ncbi:MAG TPA: butyryl-CoA dehydrogenase [Chloroflexi bacterium]|nr:MAG: butyryl-CoA dehydrogenase [Chloroflexota bacterium]HDD56014.1 butyryl-CoA dehydrogenase [Chloroflexota bacterium]
MVQRMVRDFAVKEVLPGIQERDRAGGMAPFIIPRMAELGILGITIPVRYGGQGMDYISLGLVSEELEAVDTSLRVVISVHNGLSCLTLLQWGTEKQKEEYLVPLAKGEKIGCGAFTEPGAGSDFANIQATARKEGDSYILNGEKMWISLATAADYAVATFRTDPQAEPPYRGLSTFIVDLDSPGITRGDIHGKLGVRAGSTGWINFQDVRIPVGNLLGEEGEGFKTTMSAFDNGRYTVAAGATGLIRASLEASSKYVKERTVGGKPLSEMQLIQEKLALMALDYQAARLLYLQAGWLKNQGIRNTRETSAAKLFATEASFRAASEAVQVHGAYGYSDEYPVERYFRNARGAMIYEGSSEIQSLIQADYALKKRRDKKLRRELPAYDPETWV